MKKAALLFAMVLVAIAPVLAEKTHSVVPCDLSGIAEVFDPLCWPDPDDEDLDLEKRVGVGECTYAGDFYTEGAELDNGQVCSCSGGNCTWKSESA